MTNWEEQVALLFLTIYSDLMIIPGASEPSVRTLRATIPENESQPNFLILV